MAQTWWIVVPSLSDQERNGQATPADAIIAQVSDSSQQYKTWLNTDNGGATYNGKTYYRRMGPFTNLKDAQDAYKTGAQNAPTGIPGIDITPQGGITTSNPFQGLADVANALAKIGAVMFDIGKAVTDGKMWRSLGWLILGLLLALGGAALWLKGSFNPISMLKKGVPSGGS